MNLDEDNPCPHCGNIQTLTDRTEDDFKPIIPKDLQFNFREEMGANSNIFTPPTPQEIYGNESGLPKPPGMNTDLPKPPRTGTGLPMPPQPAMKRISQDIPLDNIIPTIEDVSLDPASQKVYFQLSIEFQIILNNASNYRQGLFRWNLLLPDRLQEYGLTVEAWKGIAAQGDADERIQEQLNRLLRSIFG